MAAADDAYCIVVFAFGGDRGASDMDLKWEGRCWIDNDRRENQSGYRHAFTFMSYHMLADRKCVALVHTLNKNWAERKHLLLNEIRQYDMDILCLQDVDHYAEWWCDSPDIAISYCHL